MQRAPYERRRPWVLCFIGYPGFGKTTQALFLGEALGVERLRLGRFMKDRGLQKTADELESPVLWYQRLLEHTDLYLHQGVRNCVETHGVAVLDGFPRSQKEVEALIASVQEQHWALTIVHFDIPDDAERVRMSLQRQRARAVKLGRVVNESWYWQKVRLAEEHELTCITHLVEQGVRVLAVDPREPLAAVARAVRRAVRLDFERLPWHWRALEIVRDTAPDAFVVGSAFYRPFFNGVYGPMQDSWHIGVAVGTDARVGEVTERLTQVAPEFRWRVGNAVRFMREKTGISAASVAESLRISHNIIGLSGGVRMLPDRTLEVIVADNAEAHLRRGIVQPGMTADKVQAEHKARMVVQDYPGLRADFIGHAPVEVIPDSATIQLKSKQMERGGKRVWSDFTDDEVVIAEQLRTFAETVEKKPVAPPIPPRAEPPSGFPWDALDAPFREWLLHELESPLPSTTRDPFLEAALLLQQGVPQKPTHQGWATHQHAASALLQIVTDDQSVGTRRALRVAALLHDLGKEQNIITPGVHGWISAKRCAAYFPAWLTEDERSLVLFLVKNHDVLGRLARGIKEPDYAGAVDPGYIRKIVAESGRDPTEALALIHAINRADVGSVAALRWALPELDLAADIVRTGLS